jgi:hypothetical protein
MRRWEDNITNHFKTNGNEGTKLVSSLNMTFILEILNSPWCSQRFGNWIESRHQTMDNGHCPVMFIVTQVHLKHSDFEWINMAQATVQWRALVNTVMNLRVPHNAGKFLSYWGTVCFYKRTLVHTDNWNYVSMLSIIFNGDCFRENLNISDISFL